MSIIFRTLSAGRNIFSRTVVATMAHWFVNFGFVNIVLLLFFSESAVWMAQVACLGHRRRILCVSSSCGMPRQVPSSARILILR